MTEDYYRFPLHKSPHATPQGFVDLFWDPETGSFLGQTFDGSTSLGNGSTLVSDDAYSAENWNGVIAAAPSKNAVRDKFESLVAPDAVSFAGGNPNASIVTVTGITDPVGSDPIVLLATANLTWSLPGDEAWGLVRVLNDSWNFSNFSNTFVATVTNPTSNPDGLAGWEVTSGSTETGDLTIVATPLVATHFGQWCLSTTAWWQWNGSSWVPRFTLYGAPIVWVPALGAYRSISSDDLGAFTSTPFE